MHKHQSLCAKSPYYFSLYDAVDILIMKLLTVFYKLSNKIQSKAIMWQASIYIYEQIVQM